MNCRPQDDLSGNGTRSVRDQVRLLRWILIVASAYIVLFSYPPGHAHSVVALFICCYLPSNLVLRLAAPRVRSDGLLLGSVVLFDTLAVSLGIWLTGNPTGDFFLLYFVVLFIAALADSLPLVLGVALLMGIVDVYTVRQVAGADALMRGGHLLRIPFLFVTALAFALLVRQVRKAEENVAQAQSLTRLQTDAVAMLAHDIKNPLSIVQGVADILRSSSSLEDRRSLVDTLEANAQRATTLAINFTDACRLESGSLKLSTAPTSLNEIVEYAVESQAPVAKPREISIRVDLAAGLPVLALDARSFDRVVVNLLNNAIKYSPRGGEIHVGTALRGDRVALSVRDQGPGIAVEKRAELFQRYGTLAHSLRDGTGLGLFIVRTISEAHGGRVNVECPVEGGSIFEVSLPIARSLTG